MINLEGLLLELVAELSKSEFDNACEKAGISEGTKDFILDTLDSRGV